MAQKLSKRSFGSVNISKEMVHETGVIGINLEVSEIEIKNLIENLETISEAVTIKVARVLSSILIDLISEAQPRVPYYPGGTLGAASTGELRESGRATISLDNKEIELAAGNVDGSVSVRNTNFSSFSGRTYFIMGNVSYTRIKGDMDLAIWTHETLLGYDDRVEGGPPAARSEGTGPKYLENPWFENSKRYSSMIREAVNKFPSDVRTATTKKIISSKGKKISITKVIKKKLLDRIRSITKIFRGRR
jgi:hypothetical protein